VDIRFRSIIKNVLKLTAVAGAAVTAATAVALFPAAASASTTPRLSPASCGVVYAQNDSLTGNQVVSFDRAADGTLSQAGTYATGGLGGRLTGSVVDHLADQGALGADGTLTARGNFSADAGTVDAAVSPDGKFRYVEHGAAGVIDAFSIDQNGALTKIGTTTLPNAPAPRASLSHSNKPVGPR
jgi:hypothetical protein